MDDQVIDAARDSAKTDEINEFFRKFSQEEKGIDNFFLEIVRADDTTKIGNLTKDELGTPMLPVRTLKELSADCLLIPSMSSFSKSFNQTSEDILASSLSREGFLIKMRVTQVKKFMDKAKKKIRSGLFGKKEEDVEE